MTTSSSTSVKPIRIARKPLFKNWLFDTAWHEETRRGMADDMGVLPFRRGFRLGLLRRLDSPEIFHPLPVKIVALREGLFNSGIHLDQWGGKQEFASLRLSRNFQPSFALVTTLHCVAIRHNALGIGVGSYR